MNSLPVAALILVAMVLFSSCQTKNLSSAKIYIQQDDWTNALKQLELAVEATPENAEARFYLGSAYGKSGEFGRMNTEYGAAITLDAEWEPKVALSREEFWVESYNRGVGSINTEDYARAIEEFEDATIIDPKRVPSMKNLGVSYLRAGRVEEAIQAYEKARALDPEDLELSLLIGQLHYNGQRYGEAAEHLQRFLGQSRQRRRPDHTGQCLFAFTAGSESAGDFSARARGRPGERSGARKRRTHSLVAGGI